MLEKFLIFTRRGLILWTCKDLENALRGSPIDTLIRSCLLEECSSVASYNYDIPGAAYTLKWTFHNKLGPVFGFFIQTFYWEAAIDLYHCHTWQILSTCFRLGNWKIIHQQPLLNEDKLGTL